MSIPEKFMISFEGSKAAETKNTKESNLLESKTQGEAIATACQPLPASKCHLEYDYFHKNNLIKWFEQIDVIDNIEAVYFCPNSREVVIRTKNPEAANKITVRLCNIFNNIIYIKDLDEKQIKCAALPSPDLACFLGFKYIPFEKDAIHKNKKNEQDSVQIDHEATKLKDFGNVEIKLPYIIKHLAPKVLYYILSRIEKYGFNPELFQDQNKLPTFEELLETLEFDEEALPPNHQELFKKYENLDIIRLQDSKKALGFTRILIGNFELMLKALTKLPTKSEVFVKEKIEGGLRALTPAVGVSANALFRMLNHYYGSKPIVNFGYPRKLGKQLIIPSHIDVPRINTKRRTAFIIDLSNSMTWGTIKREFAPEKYGEIARLTAAKEALCHILEKLSCNPHEEVVVIGYNDGATVIVEPTLIQASNLLSIQTKVNNSETGGESTRIKPALQALKRYFPNKKEAAIIEMNVLILTDGEFSDTTDYDVSSTNPLNFKTYLKKEFADLPKATFNCIGLNLKPGIKEQYAFEIYLSAFVEMSQQNRMGGQLKYTPTEQVKKVMSELVLNETVGTCDLAVRFYGAKKEDLGLMQLLPAPLEIPSILHVPFTPNAMLYVEQSGHQNLFLDIEVTYENNMKSYIKAELSCEMLKNVKAVENWNLTHYLERELLKAPRFRDATNKGQDRNDQKARNQILLNIYNEAVQTNSKELRELLLTKLKPFIVYYKQVNIDCSYVSKTAKLMNLKKLYASEDAMNSRLIREILSEEITILMSDSSVCIESYLFQAAGVKSLSEFNAKPPAAQLTAYEIVESNVNTGLAEIPISIDKNVLLAQLRSRIDKLWADATLCNISNVASREHFHTLSIEDRTKYINILRQKATSKGHFEQIDQYSQQQLKEEGEACIISMYHFYYDIADKLDTNQIVFTAYKQTLDGVLELKKQLEKDNDFDARRQMELENVEKWIVDYRGSASNPENIKMVERRDRLRAENRFNLKNAAFIIESLKEKVQQKWRDSMLCICSNTRRIEFFNRQSVVIRFKAYQETYKLTEEYLIGFAKQKDILMELSCRISELWEEGSLCHALNCEDLNTFVQKSITQQLQACKSVFEKAKAENRVLIADHIKKGIDSLEVIAYIEECQGKTNKEFFTLDINEKMEATRTAIEKARKLNDPNLIKKLSEYLEKINRYQDPRILNKEAGEYFCKAIRQESMQTFNSECTFIARKYAFEECILKAQTENEFEIAQCLKRRSQIETEFFAELYIFLSVVVTLKGVDTLHNPSAKPQPINPLTVQVTAAVNTDRYMKRTVDNATIDVMCSSYIEFLPRLNSDFVNLSPLIQYSAIVMIRDHIKGSIKGTIKEMPEFAFYFDDLLLPYTDKIKGREEEIKKLLEFNPLLSLKEEQVQEANSKSLLLSNAANGSNPANGKDKNSKFFAELFNKDQVKSMLQKKVVLVDISPWRD